MKALKLFRWIIYNVAELALLYYFLFEKIEWCGNLYKFLLWTGFFVALLMIAVVNILNDKDISRKTAESTAHIPTRTNTTIDVIASLVLAGFGFWGLGAIKIISVILFVAMKSKAEEITNKEDTTNDTE